ncbi:ATP-binding protein [Vibrio sp. SM6]|uniref:ATP-binding protein n=1 Tax=Vibrio agarilyticus TaxID=2726741 RepID=A0A7X8YGK4_9VIBR|nr:tight adherence pilus pseudopilin TadF [Vibrio agarilyticus]NLS13073.1 ATP-binding protein [Vibrio agarilyticus]
MNVINSTIKQAGTFTIEFSLVGIFLGVLFLFSADIIEKLSMKGKLDRLSYSATSLVKERTQLYGENYLTSSQDADLVFRVVRDSLTRTTGSFDVARFGMVLEEQTYASDHSANSLKTLRRGTLACTITAPLSQVENDLTVVTSWGRKATLYRVTLCYSTENMVEKVLDNGFAMVSSSAVVVGR